MWWGFARSSEPRRPYLVVALGALPRFTGQAAPESPGRWCSTGPGFVMKRFIPSVNGERYVEVARSLPRPFVPPAEGAGA